MEPTRRKDSLASLQSTHLTRRSLLKVAVGAAGAVMAAPYLVGCASTTQTESKVTMGYGTALVQLDPHRNENTVHESVLRNMYDALVVFSPDLKSIQPALALEWKRLDDLRMQFKLRENVKFHNGEEFNAEAVKTSLERMLNPETKAPLLSTYGIIEKAEVVDKYTVNIVTKYPDPVLLRRMAGFHTNVVAPKYATTVKPEEMATKPVGTGPYKFVSWTKDADMVLEANPEYWGGAPKVKKVVIRGIPESGTRVSALMAGDVDITNAVPTDDIDRINKGGKARTITIPGNRVVFYGFDLATKPMDDKLVRQAINYGSNFEGIIKTVLGGKGKRISTIMNDWYIGYDAGLKPYPYDPDKAKALLKEAGYPNGVEIAAYHQQGRLPKDKEIGEALAGELSKIGVKINITWMDWGTLFSNANAGKVPGLVFRSWGNWMHDADNSMFTLFHSSTIYAKNWHHFNNPQYDKLVEGARQTLDEAKRSQFYADAQKLLYEEAPCIFGYAIEDVYAVNNRVEWQPRTDEMIWYRDMGIKA